MSMRVVIMAGGKGSRIASLKADVPKPMIEICGKPILEYQIENLKSCGLTDITIVIGHLGHVIQQYFGDGSKHGVRIGYFVEDVPLGTAGALYKIPELTDDFLLLCGDVILNVDFNRFIQFHKSHNAWASLMTHPNDHPQDSSLIVTEKLFPNGDGGLPRDTHRVVCWMNKEDERLFYQNRVNAGIEIISAKLLEEAKRNYEPRHPQAPERMDLDRDILKPCVKTGHIFAYDTTEYIKDMGTPERFYEVERDMKAGIINARNLLKHQKAIFLDRDGTINYHIGFLTNHQQFELIPGVAEAISLINKSGYLAIIVTNQPVIARGECTWEELQVIHNKMETELGKKGAFVDAIYVCPHHPDKGFAGERPEYKCDCDCRKPAAGMLKKAAEDFNIDLSASYMIGDGQRDIESGENAGCLFSAKIRTNQDYSLTKIIEEIFTK